MPELPEVETIRRGLERHLPGRTIRRAEVRTPRLVVRPDPESFALELAGQTFRCPRRVGKRLILDLETVTVLVHLGMTGQLTFRPPARPDEEPVADPHVHLVLHLVDGSSVCYRDVRKFGRWLLHPRDEVAGCPELAGLGPDPLTPAFTLEGLAERLARTSRALKAVLLDQSVVAGLGNIYVDEVLHRAGLRPTRRASGLAAREVRRLYEALPRLLQEAVENRGTTFSDYRDADGERGHHAATLRVYGRHGQPCPACGGVLRKTTVAGRTSSWCPKCQR